MNDVVSPVTGVAAGVPFVALPPASGSATAPLVVAWHLLDAPCTEAAFAAALPLHGLDAWRVFLGLPMCGSRLPDGGPEAIMGLAYEDAVLNLYGPIAEGAAREFGPALAALREQLGIAPGPIGLLGGSLGSAVAQLVLADSGVDVAAAALVSPMSQLRPVVAMMEAQFGVTYGWAEASDAVADRLDFVARAEENQAAENQAAENQVPVLLVVGEDDDAAFREPAAELAAALPRAELVVVAGMGHELAEAPGVEPAPQTPSAVEVDRLVTAHLREHLPR